MDLVSPLDFDELKEKQEAYFETPLANDAEDETEPAKQDDCSLNMFCRDFFNGNNIDSNLANPYNYDEMADKCENLTPDGGVKKLLIKRGIGHIVPATSNVTVVYSAYTEFDDSPFDFTTRPTHFDIGMTTLKGFAIALSSMRKSEKASFYLSPDYAYGKLGCPKRIPPDATCLFIIEMIDYQEEGGVGSYFDRPPIERHDVAYDIIVSVVKKKKKDAKMNFQRKDYGKAKRMYERCILDLSHYNLDSVDDVQTHKQLLVCLNCNAALCCLKLNEYTSCIKFADAALEINDKYVKAIFAKGKALHKTGDFDGALKLLLEAKTLNPKNKDINEELHYLDKYVEKAKLKEKTLCQKIMKGMHIEQVSHSDNKENKKEEDNILADDVKEVFLGTLKNLKESDDLSRKLTLNCDTFAPGELYAMSRLAQSMDLKVHTFNKNDGLDKIVISKL